MACHYLFLGYITFIVPMGRLIFVPTPIGNLEDITLRAIRVLGEADAVAAEDTRSASILFKKYGISTPLFPYHVKNERKRADDIVRQVSEGRTIAVISEAGTPGISDPGWTLARKAVENGIPFEVLPGPTAFVPALVLSGFPVTGASFEGFLPHTGKGRRRRLRTLANQAPRTCIFYVSPHRIADFVEDAAAILGDRNAVLCREISKVFEEVIRGRLSDIAEKLEGIKGELVFVIGPD